MKKKILFMINSMGIGGAEKSLSSLLSLFDYEQYDVSLLLIHQGGALERLLPAEVHIIPRLPYFEFCSLPLLKQITSGNVRFLKARVSAHSQLTKNEKLGFPLHATQAYWSGAQFAFDTLREEYDVAVAWGQGTPTHFVAEKVRAKKKIAWINADYEAVGHNKCFDTPIYEEYHNIVCVSDKLTAKLKHVFPQFEDRIVTIYDINSSKLVQKMAEESVELPRLHGVILNTTGRLVQLKGYDLAIAAAHILKEKGIDFTWLVCGEGVERQTLESMILQYGLEKDFILLGAKTNPYPYMKLSDIYVQTSRFEGYCLTLTEARILNRPCVTTRFDVVFDQMVDGENGIVVEMTPEAIAAGILRLLRDKDLYEHIHQYQICEVKGNEKDILKVYQLFGN